MSRSEFGIGYPMAMARLQLSRCCKLVDEACVSLLVMCVKDEACMHCRVCVQANIYLENVIKITLQNINCLTHLFSGAIREAIG